MPATSLFMLLASVSTLISVGALALWSASAGPLSPGSPARCSHGRVEAVLSLCKNLMLRIQWSQGRSPDVPPASGGMSGTVSKVLATTCAGIAIVVGYLLGIPAEGAVAGLGIVLVLYFVRAAAGSRWRTRFNSQLIDAIFLLSGSQRAGFSLVQSLEFTARESERPMKDILLSTVRDIKYGIDLEQALYRHSSRLGSEEFDLLVTSLTIQRETGGNVAEVLERIGEGIRERRRVEAKLKASTIQGKLTGLVVVIVPLGLFVVLNAIAPEFLHPLWATAEGRGLLALAVTLQSVGALMIKHITTVRF